MRQILGVRPLAALFLLGAFSPPAGDGFVTRTFPVKLEGNLVEIDLAGLPAGADVRRAVLRVSEEGHKTGAPIRVLFGDRPLALRPPDYRAFDALPAVRAGRPVRLRVEESGGVNFASALLEASYAAPVPEPFPEVRDLRAVHRSGQTFLTWKEPEDVVGSDTPVYEEFEKAVLDARARRRLVYRVYRHSSAITPEALGGAELLAEIPEAISCWNLRQLKVKDSEHIKRNEKPSVLHGQHLYPGQVMEHRYRLEEGAPPLPRATGFVVLTAREERTSHYAVTVAIDGREAVAAPTTATVREKPSAAPALVWQRTSKPQDNPPVDVYCTWLEPPFVPQRRAVDFYFPRWKDLPKGSDAQRLPVYLVQGGREGDLDQPSMFAARRYVEGAYTLALAPGHTMFWPGQHEAIGTLRGFDEGAVWNYEQRRAMLLLNWALENRELHLDPERIYTWGLLAAWGLRHGDRFAAILSDGHNTFKTSRYPKSFFWRWYPKPGAKNWLGEDHLDYLDLARWVRENPAVELPYWVGFPAYGFFPDHTLGDYGFKPWQEFLAAMKETRRAFAATWLSNGPGETLPLIKEMVPRLRLHQSLPAFTNSSLDSSPRTETPRGTHRYLGDKDFTTYADKEGGINLHPRWDTDSIVDAADRWEMTVWLSPKAPLEKATVDLTPRRCQAFKPKPGDRFRWTSALADGADVQSGEVAADALGLVTLPQIDLQKTRRRVQIHRAK